MPENRSTSRLPTTSRSAGRSPSTAGRTGTGTCRRTPGPHTTAAGRSRWNGSGGAPQVGRHQRVALEVGGDEYVRKFGGWSGGINAKAQPKVKDAAYALFSYMSQPEQSNVDVTIGATGFNPYRLSQFENLDLWEEAGMSQEAAESYLGAIQNSLNSPNMVLDLRIQVPDADVRDTARSQADTEGEVRPRAMDVHADGGRVAGHGSRRRSSDSASMAGCTRQPSRRN